MKKQHTLCSQCLFYFVWRKCHDPITIFLKNKTVPLLLKISILIEDCAFCHWNIVPEPVPPTSNHHHQHTNFVQGTPYYSLFLKCAYTSSDSWIRHWRWRCHELQKTPVIWLFFSSHRLLVVLSDQHVWKINITTDTVVGRRRKKRTTYGVWQRDIAFI